MGTPKRSCVTCRERRVLCDRAVPTCQQCIRTKRKCKGYGLRLSWPHAGDNRRAIVARSGAARGSNGALLRQDSHLVSVSSWDVQLHYYLTASEVDGAWPVLPVPMIWNPILFDVGDGDLFLYFQSIASKSLTTFGQDPGELGNVLIRMAVAGDSPSSSALLQSLLALSSLHRYGVQSQALELKISSIKALAAASHADLGSKEVIQHVATGMLLCSFEVHQASCTSSQWTWYIAGVKKVLNASATLLKSQNDSDLSTLMDWVYYHEILARFTLRHWQHDAQRLEMNTTSIWSEVCTHVTDDRAVSHRDFRSSPTLATLELLSDVCDAIATRPPNTLTPEDVNNYKGFMRLLDWRIRNIQASHATGKEMEEDGAGEERTLVELYQLAILVYLNRVSGNIFGQGKKVQEHVEKGLSIFAQLDSCERQFPIFILGSEARTDEQRTSVLNLIDRTEKRSSSRSLNHVRLLILAVWAQDDLADKEVNYWDKMSAIISRCSILPSLV